MQLDVLNVSCLMDVFSLKLTFVVSVLLGVADCFCNMLEIIVVSPKHVICRQFMFLSCNTHDFMMTCCELITHAAWRLQQP